MKCGVMEVLQDGNIRGEFASWAYPSVQIALRQNVSRSSDKAPSHEVIGKAPHGGWVVIGSAWRNKIKQGDKLGMDCFSLTLEEPTLFDKPVRLSAFPDRDGKHFTLEFDRARPDTEQAAAA